MILILIRNEDSAEKKRQETQQCIVTTDYWLLGGIFSNFDNIIDTKSQVTL